MLRRMISGVLSHVRVLAQRQVNEVHNQGVMQLSLCTTKRVHFAPQKVLKGCSSAPQQSRILLLLSGKSDSPLQELVSPLVVIKHSSIHTMIREEHAGSL